MQARLTKAEKQRLLERAVRERERREDANRKASEKRAANGLQRIEKTVPTCFREEIRQIIKMVIADLQAGRQPNLQRRIKAGASAETCIPIVADEVQLVTTPTPSEKCSGLAARKRAQNARRRQRQQALGLVRTSFEVPAPLVPRIARLVEQVAAWMVEGFDVTVEEVQPTVENVSPVSVQAISPSSSPVAQTLDAIAWRQTDDAEDCPLFDDIQAMARLEEGASARQKGF